MKIFFIGQKGIPSTGGGVESHVENLAVKLANQGHEVFAYTRHSYSDKNLKEFNKVKLIALPSLNTKSLDAISHTFLACLDYIFRRKADVVHFHSIGPASLIWLIKIFRPKTKIVFTFHSQCYYNAKWNSFAKLYLSFGEKMGCKLADQVIVVSRSLQQYVEDKYKVKAHYIPNGVKKIKNREAQEIKKQWNLEKGSYILSVSRVVKNKGLEFLIQAYKQITTNKKLVIVGNGDFLKKLEKLADKHPNIIFTGKQSGETLEELYSNASLFIQASEAEGLSISLLEAMSAQIPLIVSNIKANTDVVQEDAIRFRSKDIDDLKNKIELFLQDKSTEKESAIDKMIKNNYNRVINEYNWDVVVQFISSIYKK